MSLQQAQIEHDQVAAIGGSSAVGIPLNSEVTRFCMRNNLSEALSKAIDLAHATFSGISTITAEIEIDPDSDSERVILLLTTDASIEDVLKAKKAYTKKWISIVPPAVCEKIGLLYNIA